MDFLVNMVYEIIENRFLDDMLYFISPRDYIFAFFALSISKNNLFHHSLAIAATFKLVDFSNEMKSNVLDKKLPRVRISFAKSALIIQ